MTVHDTRPQAATDGIAEVTHGIAVERQAGSLGAYISGVDLAGGFDDALVAVLRGALLEHLVVCIRGQEAMTPDDQLAFARAWGTVLVHPYVPSIEGHPGVMRIYDTNAVTQTWHSDTTHVSAPPSITMLLARTIPPYGGDTMFANQYLAYETLSPGLRATLDSLRAVHYGTELAKEAGVDAERVTNSHPVVRHHPETGRRALYVNDNYVRHFDGWTEAESAPLLKFLFEYAGHPEFTWRHKWKVGDLLLWDNRCTQHAVIADTDGAERLLHRITIEGDVPE